MPTRKLLVLSILAGLAGHAHADLNLIAIGFFALPYLA